VVSKALSSYACFFEDHREKHGAKKKNKAENKKDLSEEEQIYLICDDSKNFQRNSMTILV